MRLWMDSGAFLPSWLLAMAGALALGVLLGKRRRHRHPGASEGASWGLTILLLGLTWLATYQTYTARVTLVHEECDAIAESFRMCSILEEDDRRWVRSHLLAYVDAKLRYLDAGGPAVEHHQPELFRLQGEMWERLTPNDSVHQALLKCVSTLIRLHFRRQYSYRERVPEGAMGVLAGCCLASAFLAGWARAGEGLGAWIAPALLVLMLLASFTVIRAFDDPISGVQVDYANLRDLRNFMMQNPE